MTDDHRGADNPPNRRSGRNGRHYDRCMSTECPCFLEGESWGNENADDWREAVASVRARYPEDIFPWPSETIEGKVAHMIRVNCDEIVRIATEAEHG